MTRRKEGLILMVLGATALVLTAPWWLLGTLRSTGLGPRLGLQVGLTLVFLGFFWMFKRDRKGPVALRVVPNSESDESSRKQQE